MKVYFFYAFLVIGMCSCAKSVENTELQTLEKTTLRSSEYDSSQEYRLRINENSTALTTVYYNNESVVDVTYELVEAISSDRISSLELRAEDEMSSPTKIDYFDKDVVFGLPNTTFAHRTNGTGGDETYCECNDPGWFNVNDCVQQAYHRIKYCDGNFCGACSLVVVLGDTPTPIINTSVVFLPINF